MSKPNTKPYPPEFIRRVFDDVANHGVKPGSIADLTGVASATIAQWLAQGDVRLRVPASDEYIEAALQKATTYAMRERKETGNYTENMGTHCNYRPLNGVQRDYVANGFAGTDAPKDVSSPQEMAAFAGVLAVVDRQLEMLDLTSRTAETIQEVTTALTAAISLKQLRAPFIDPPQVKDWREVKIMVDIAREALDMNRKLKESNVQSRNSVDVNILSYDPRTTVKKTVTLNAEVLDTPLED